MIRKHSFFIICRNCLNEVITKRAVSKTTFYRYVKNPKAKVTTNGNYKRLYHYCHIYE